MAEQLETQAEEAVQDSSEQDVSTAEQQPEPAAGEATDEGETGAEPSGETQETQDEGTDDNWLPTEQAKEYPLDVLVEYAAKRFPKLSADLIAKDPGVRDVLKGKLDADIHVRSLTQQDGTGEETDELGEFLGEEGLELPQPEVEQGTEQSASAVAQSDPRATHNQRVDQVFSQIDPKLTEELGREVLSALQINADPKYIDQLQTALRNPATPAEQRGAIQQHLDLVNNAGRLGATLGKKALDLMATALPVLLPEYLEQLYPGTQERHQRNVANDAWEQVRKTVGKDQKPLYSNLPALYTPEFMQVLVKAEKHFDLPHGAFDSIQFKDKQGNHLPFNQNLRAVLRMVARGANGQAVSPAMVNQALQTGKNKREDRAQTRAAGRALGSGQPTSSSGGGNGNDDIFGPGLAEYKRRGG